MQPAARTKIGPDEIVALLGEGGMGEVYRAHDPHRQYAATLKKACSPLYPDSGPSADRPRLMLHTCCFTPAALDLQDKFLWTSETLLWKSHGGCRTCKR